MQVFGIQESDHSDLHPPANAQSILHTIQYTKSGKAEESVRKVWHKLKCDDYEIAQLITFDACRAMLIRLLAEHTAYTPQ